MRWLASERVLLDDEMTPAALAIDAGGKIAAIAERPPAGEEATDMGDVDLVPGFVDLHGDCLENLAHPRPSAALPLAAAIHDLDDLCAAHGVTTTFVCIGLEDDVEKHRGDDRAIETADALERMLPGLRTSMRVHLRIDVTADSLAVAERIARSGLVALVSYMDHTPGQGQFADETTFAAYYNTRAGASEETTRARLAAKRAGQKEADRRREEIAAFARRIGARLAAHDDDSEAAVARAVALGAAISEFPVNETAARAARAARLGIVMGAPNARRGTSHVGNLSARDALAKGLLDALASDYHPPSLLAAAGAIADAGVAPWSRALALIADGPARIVGMHDRGAFAVGRRADIVALERIGGLPRVVQTWVGGRPAFGASRTRVALA